MQKITRDTGLFSGKVCTDCGRWKPFSDYSLQGRAAKKCKTLASKCKACVQVRTAARVRANPKQKRASDLRRIELNPTRQAENLRRWYQANKTNHRERGKKWAKEHRDQAVTYAINRRAQLLSSEGSHTDAEWLEVCERAQFKCLRCGAAAKLTRDHIVPLSKGGTNHIGNIQPLCQACNSSKGTRTEDYRTWQAAQGA